MTAENFFKKLGSFALTLSFLALYLVIQLGTAIVTLLAFFISRLRSLNDLSMLAEAALETLESIYEDSYILSFMNYTATASCFIVFLALYILLYGRKKRPDFHSIFKPLNLISIIVMGLCIQIYTSIALSYLLPLFENVMKAYEELMSNIVLSSGAIDIIMVGILAPISEECLFRGIVTERLSKIMPYKAVIIVQALLFGLLHMNIVQFMYAAMIGLILGCLKEKFNSIIPCCLLHIAINSTAFIDFSGFEAQLSTPIIGILVFIFTLLITAALLYFLIAPKRKPQA